MSALAREGGARADASSRTEAAGSSFYAAMRLLPKVERNAMFAVYGFCREVDDIADEPGLSVTQRRAKLDAWRNKINTLYTDPYRSGLADLALARRRFDLARSDFQAVIDGMAMDVDGPLHAPDLATFDLYCDRVASAVGRLGVRIFGMEREPGERLAHHLGRALQFTNILRDLDEDAGLGRLYLPAEALREAGLHAVDRTAEEVIARPEIDAACRWLSARAREHYRGAAAILDARPAGRLAPPRLMSAVYQRLLDRMEAVGWAPPRQRERVGKRALLAIVLRHGWRR